MCIVKRKCVPAVSLPLALNCLHLSHETINSLAKVKMNKESLLKVELQILNSPDLPIVDLQLLASSLALTVGSPQFKLIDSELLFPNLAIK